MEGSRRKDPIEFKRKVFQGGKCSGEELIYLHSNCKWVYPLFDKNFTCTSGRLAIADAPNFGDTYNPRKVVASD